MIPLTLGAVASLTGARLVGPPGTADLIVSGPVSTDSRDMAPGGLYIARLGEFADGHDYVEAARAAGAVATLGSREVAGPCLVTDDVQTAFGRLARGVLDAVPGLTVVGITGSSGKTSTKDLLAHVLASHAPTVAPVASFNGEIGVPLTVCRVTAQTRFLVAEMGARGIGHLTYLTGIAPPSVAVVLNVGLAHVGEFGSADAVATAKSELVSALPAAGVAVLNLDDPRVAAMTAVAAARGAQVVGVGETPDAVVRAVDVCLDALGRPSFDVLTPAGRASVTLGLHGRHHVANALAVIAAAQACGLELTSIVAALGSARPVNRWRMEVHERADGVLVVNDAYNANPASMRAAVDALVAMSRPASADTPRRPSWAVLGGMLELGDLTVSEHHSLGAYLREAGIDHVLAVGSGARQIADGAAATGSSGEIDVRWVADTDSAYDLLTQELRSGDVVLLKSSRDSGLRWLGDRLVGLEVPK